MKFGLEKCAAMTMKRGKRVHSDGIALPDGTQLRALGEEESYKYLGVLCSYTKSQLSQSGQRLSK